jgi:hypothetical protein
LKRIMEIIEAAEFPKHGIIISGSNPEFDDLSEGQIKQNILVQGENGNEVRFAVKGIDAPFSFSGIRYIHICIGNPAEQSNILKGSIVFGNIDIEGQNYYM